jgi:HEAT repeat protein
VFGPFGPFGSVFGWREFLVGVVAAVLLALLLSRLRPVFRWIRSALGTQLDALRAGLRSRAIDRYQLELVSRMETLHLARPIFALDEVLITPRVLAPPQPTDPLHPEAAFHSTLSVVPNLPDVNYLSGIFVAHSLTLPQALAGGRDLLLTGEPGSGKTTALAYLALRLANRASEASALHGLVPVFVHAADLDLSRSAEKDSLQPLILAAQRTASSGVASMLPAYLRRHFSGGRAILLLDGLDEFPPDQILPVAGWLQVLRKEYPGNRMVVAANPMGYDGLLGAGLALVSLAPWTEHDQRTFLSAWAKSWREFVLPRLPKGRLSDLDPALINGWLAGAMRGATPAEVTLRSWASYAGDVRGWRPVDGLASYTARILSAEEQSHASQVGLSWLEGGMASLPERSVPRGVPVGDLLEAGILARRADGKLSFQQPVVGAYFAARGMLESGLLEGLLNSAWAPAQTALRYFATLGQADSAVQRLLNTTREPLKLEMLQLGRWLPGSPSKAPWRTRLLRELAMVVQEPRNPYGLRLRALHLLAQSGEPSTNILFQRMLRSEAATSRVLGALGLGGIADADSIPQLAAITTRDPVLLVRQAACLGLAAIGTDPALEALGHALLEGEEAVRLAAAEALAANTGEGYIMLREAAEHDALLTRRAAVFGLARIPERWAEEILEKVQLDDNQWVVRGAAAEALEQRRNPPWKIHAAPRDLSELPWLLAYAGREGVGIVPGRAALDLVRRALNNGTADEQIAAIEALAWSGGDELSMELYKALRSGEDHLRDSAFETLWRVAASGVQLPSPMTYGM